MNPGFARLEVVSTRVGPKVYWYVRIEMLRAMRSAIHLTDHFLLFPIYISTIRTSFVKILATQVDEHHRLGGS